MVAYVILAFAGRHCCVNQFHCCHPVIYSRDSVKILIILVFFIIFWIPWSSHGMTPNAFFDSRNNAFSGMTDKWKYYKYDKNLLYSR
jgi:hypothetical protein